MDLVEEIFHHDGVVRLGVLEPFAKTRGRVSPATSPVFLRSCLDIVCFLGQDFTPFSLRLLDQGVNRMMGRIGAGGRMVGSSGVGGYMNFGLGAYIRRRSSLDVKKRAQDGHARANTQKCKPTEGGSPARSQQHLGKLITGISLGVLVANRAILITLMHIVSLKKADGSSTPLRNVRGFFSLPKDGDRGSGGMVAYPLILVSLGLSTSSRRSFDRSGRESYIIPRTREVNYI